MSSLLKKLGIKTSRPLLIPGCFKIINQSNTLKTSAFNMIKLSDCLNAEPTKAKKRVDPALLMLKENRKRKRLEKEIKKLEKFGRRLKPIEELEPDRSISKELALRKRKVENYTKEENDEAFVLKKEWAKYIYLQHQNQMQQIERALKSQEKALKELKKDNLDLYNKAIQLDSQLLPFVREGPVHTPPTKKYDPPEGDYNDCTYLYDRR